MEKYCYVTFGNQTDYSSYSGEYKSTEVGKAIDKYAVVRSLGDYQPQAAALLKVKQTEKYREEKGMFGRIIRQPYYVWENFFIICEENGNYLQDIVSGKTFLKQKNDTYVSTTYPQGLSLRIVRYESISTVVKKLKSLNTNDKIRIKNAMNNLDREIAIASQKDSEIRRREKAQMQKDIEYIKNFRNRYDK